MPDITADNQGGLQNDCPLREDLEILQSAPDASGEQGWIIHDPVQHRYFRLDETSAEILYLWQQVGSLQHAMALWMGETGQSIDDEELMRLMEFARSSNLVHDIAPGYWQQISQKAALAQQSIWSQLAHKYLFLKVPLFKSQYFLEKTLPLASPILSRGAIMLLSVIGLIGLYLVSRQWDQFLGTFSYFFSFEGLTWFTLTLLVLKTAHELGHAYMAVRYGCRVPVMGVAFMVLAPMLYTDVSDAWRLTSRRQRLMISAAGMMVELGIAALATFAWVFLPDGIMRSMAFMLATTGWIMSLGLNLNPFMRFDGYYLLSDFWGIDNLQPRAFAIGRWKLRQLLIAPDLKAPEVFADTTRRLLVVYAWATWIYRLILFTAIALMVYHFAFKLLGIILFALEIWLLILQPAMREIAQWCQIEPGLVERKRIAMIGAIASLLLVVFALPWSSRVTAPAVLVAADLEQIYPARAAKVLSVEMMPQAEIEAGVPLIHLEAPEIESEIRSTTIRRNLAQQRIGHALGSEEELQESPVIRQELGALQTQLSGLETEQMQLVLTAKEGGRIVQLAPDLHPGRWVEKGELLALISRSDRQLVKGYVTEDKMARLRNLEDAKSADANDGRFIPDDLTLPSIPVRLRHLAGADSAHVDMAELASVYGGPIAVEQADDKSLVPVKAQYLMELEPLSSSIPAGQVIRGMVHLDGEPRSLLLDGLRHVARILIRETGF